MTARLDEIAPNVYRLSTPVPPPGFPGGFSFNQYLLVDDEPLLFHTGGRALVDGVREAIARVMPLERLRWISFAHVESDECGALNQLLAAAPRAQPLCGKLAAMVSMNNLADRVPRGLADGEVVALGAMRVRWVDAPHVPHAWENGFLFEETARTLLCGDLLTQPGTGDVAVTDGDVLGPSEAFRGVLDYWAHAPHTAATIETLAALAPATLACMHGSAFRGDGAAVLRALAGAVA